jgi:Flp pilus assembly pilin Flp
VLERFVRDESGLTILEYVIAGAGVILVMMVPVLAIYNMAKSKMNAASDYFNNNVPSNP